MPSIFDQIVMEAFTPDDPAEEGILFDKKQTRYNYEKFGSAINVLLITGISASGKSTQAEELASQDDVFLVPLDMLRAWWWYTLNRPEEDPFADWKELPAWAPYMTNQNPVIQFLKKNPIKPKDNEDLMNEFLTQGTNWVIRNCLNRKNTHWIIEGIDIYLYADPELVKQCAIIIRGESAAHSLIYRAKREHGLVKPFREFMWAIDDDKKLSLFRKDVLNWIKTQGSAMESLDDLDDLFPALELDLLAGGDPTMSRDQRVSAGQTDPGSLGGANAPGAQPQQADTPSTDEAPTQNQNQGANAGGDDQAAPDEGGGDDAAAGDDAGAPPDEGGDTGEDDGTGELDEDEEDAAGGDMGGGDTTTEDPNELKRKKDLRVLTCALYSSYVATLDLMKNARVPSDPALEERYSAIRNHMEKAKNDLFMMATETIKTDPYPDSLRKYTALNQLYSLSLKTLDTLIPKESADSKELEKRKS